MDVVIQPGALASVELAPSPAVAQKGETVQLAAQGFDLFKNPIEGLSFVWGAEGLAIDQTGKVTAGNQEGRYTVTVRASYRGGQRTASVTVAVPPIWVSAGNMRAARRTPTATLLADGNVLIMGAVRLAELYDSATRSFSVTGAPFCRHSGSPQATLLANGSVLITGGSSDSRCAEIYDPQTKVFSRVGDLNADRWWHTATLLGNGKVLIAGGNLRQEGLSVSHAAAEIFDPVTGTFSVTGDLNIDRQEHTATLLPSGQVLISSGIRRLANESKITYTRPNSPELFDPSSGRFKTISGLTSKFGKGEATVLNNGNVLFTSDTERAGLFDLATNGFRPAAFMTERRKWHTATLLATGDVMLTGGTPNVEPLTGLATVEIYDPDTGRFTAIDGMTEARFQHAAVLLADGSVLVIGGRGAGGDLTSAEIWLPGNR